MPLSEIVSVLAAASGVSLIFQSVLPSSLSALASESNRTLLIASDALEISSRRKISRSEYSECVMRWRSCLSSALNSSVSGMSQFLW